MGRTLALAACLIAAAALAWLAERTPRPLPGSAPAQAFSAARAFPDIAAIARAPHPTGSAANAAVRERLMRRMAELGLSPRARAADVVTGYPAARPRPTVIGGQIVNLVGVLPGRERALPAVAIMAHYDSVPGSPGAADDAAGVAAALETVRALKAQGPLRRDVVVVLTDGEEVDLMGARAFFQDDPLARNVGFVVNMEARGGGGRARMFQTGPRNGETVALFRGAVSAPSASSLAVFLYERMPNDTDFTLARAAGVPGLNFAFIGRQFDYHAASSTPAALDLGSVQDMGAQVLAVTRAAADAPALPGPAPDYAFHQLPGGLLGAYPAVFGWGVLAAAAALMGIALGRVRPDVVIGPDIARGVGAGFFLLTASAAVFHAARRASGAGFGFLEQHRLLAQVPRYETALLLLAAGVLMYAAAELARGRRGIVLVTLSAGIGGAAFGGFNALSLALGATALALAIVAFRRPTAAAGAWTGLLATGFVAALALQLFAAPAAPVVAWPLLLGCALAALSGLWTRRSWSVRILTAAGATVGLAWLGGVFHGVFLGLDAPEALAITVWLAALIIWPLAQPDKDQAGTPFVAVAVLWAGVALLALVRWHDPWTERHPQASLVVFHQDRTSGQAFRVDAAPERTGWADQVLAADGGAVGSRPLPMVFGPARAAPARPIAAPGPQFALTRDADGRLALTASPPPGTAQLILELTATGVVEDLRVQGRAAGVALAPGAPVRLRWHGAEAVALSFRSAGPGALALRYAAVTPGWPAGARPLPPRPAGVMAFDISDATVVTGAQRLTW